MILMSGDMPESLRPGESDECKRNGAAMSHPAGARRFRPALVPSLAALAAVVLCVAAGNWQRGRMHDKEALRAQQDAAAGAAPVPMPALAADADWTPLRYRRVAAAGEYDAPRQILIDNRVHDGRVGYHVVTPLKLADGRVVLVNRGWIAQGASRQDVPRVPPPLGEVTVTGRLAVPAGGYFELAGAAPAGPVWQNLEPAKFAAATGIAVLPAVIEETEGADALARDWPAPDFGIEKHRIYMMQWYAFAAIAVVLWVVLNLRRPAAR
jgi:surfeit locus 1 family protein